MINKEEARLFVRQYLTGQYTDAEHAAFLNWLHNQPNDEMLLDELTTDFKEWVSVDSFVYGPDHERIFERIQQRIDLHTESPTERHHTTSLQWVWRIAATVILAVSILLGYYKFVLQQPTKDKVAVNTPIQDVLPGGDRAILTLGDGRQIVLDTAANGELAHQEGAQVYKQVGGQLTYTTHSETTANPVYNKVSTPRGGKYRIVLPDGSIVWLNTASSIRFPTAFTGNSRPVELQGEAYFEIAENKEKPFMVAVKSTTGKDSLDIQVLGTRFNVNSYGDEPDITTTLLDGSVAVNHGEDRHLLRAAQQARAFVTGKMIVENKVDTSSVTAWHRNQFQFTSSSIEPIMRQLSRWYDLEVHYEGKINERFNATISRQVSLAKVLALLEQTNAVHFIINDRKVIVKP